MELVLVLWKAFASVGALDLLLVEASDLELAQVWGASLVVAMLGFLGGSLLEWVPGLEQAFETLYLQPLVKLLTLPVLGPVLDFRRQLEYRRALEKNHLVVPLLVLLTSAGMGH